MLILALDSTAVVGSVALCLDDKPLAHFTLKNGNTHSETLLPMVKALFDVTGKTIDDVDLLACSAGPGSFTGVRIGVATVKGLCFGKNKCVLGVSALEAMAMTQLPQTGLIVPVMDARRGEVYTAVFRAEGEALTRLMPDSAMPATALEEWLQANAAGENFLAVGDGVPVLERTFKALPVKPAPTAIAEQHAVGVAKAALAAYKGGARGTDTTLTPIYLRLPQAERERLAAAKQPQ